MAVYGISLQLVLCTVMMQSMLCLPLGTYKAIKALQCQSVQTNVMLGWK